MNSWHYLGLVKHVDDDDAAADDDDDDIWASRGGVNVFPNYSHI